MNKFTDITMKRGVIQDTGLSAWASQSTGQNKYGTIPLKRGVIQDTGFSAWANQSAGQNKYGTIPLERGVTQDSGFGAWANQSAGQNKYGTIPLERGVTQDSGFGAWANQSAGQNKYGTIPLERGVTHDSGFSTWASQVWDFGSAHGSEPSPAHSPKNIFLEILNETGQVVVRYRIHGLSVSETPVHPPAGVLHHFLQPRGTRSIQDQLAVIFQNSLKRYRP
jgi:hypothetical protein